MKRVWLLAAALLLLTACGKKETPPVALANPISASSLEALEEETGHPTAPFEALEALSVRRYDVEPVLYELEFTGEDGFAYTLRMVKGEERTDISGMYFSWTETIEEERYTLCLDDQGHGICLWQETGFAYALVMETDANRDRLLDMRTMLMGN